MPESSKHKLSSEEFKRVIDMLPTPEVTYEFLEKFSNYINSGSSRSAFEYAPGKILKIAFNKAGVYQNITEIKYYSKLFPFVPEIYDYHPDGYWIEMEKVEKPKSFSIQRLIPFIKNNPNSENAILTLWDSLKGNEEKIEDIDKQLFLIQEEIFETQSLMNSILQDSPEKDASIEIVDLENNLFQFWQASKKLQDERRKIVGPASNQLIKVVIELLYSEIEKKDIIPLLRFIKKIIDIGIEDVYSNNVGFSKSRNVPVILDYGMDDATKSVYRGKKQEDFDMEDFYSNTSTPRPRNLGFSRAEKFAEKLASQNKIKESHLIKEFINFKINEILGFYSVSITENNLKEKSTIRQTDRSSRIIRRNNLKRIIEREIKTILMESWGVKENAVFAQLKNLDKAGADFEEYSKLLSKFEKVGGGSSRVVYAIDDDLVIKLEKPGTDPQNENESDPALQTLFGNFVPKVYGRGADYRWIIAERVTPVGTKEQEQEWLIKAGLGGIVNHGLEMYDISNFLEGFHSTYEKIEQEMGKEALNKVNAEKVFGDVKKSVMMFSNSTKEANWDFTLDDLKSWAENPVIGLISRARRDNDVAVGDIGLGNIGFGADGRPVILDLGLSQSSFSD